MMNRQISIDSINYRMNAKPIYYKRPRVGAFPFNIPNTPYTPPDTSPKVVPMTAEEQAFYDSLSATDKSTMNWMFTYGAHEARAQKMAYYAQMELQAQQNEAQRLQEQEALRKQALEEQEVAKGEYEEQQRILQDAQTMYRNLPRDFTQRYVVNTTTLMTEQAKQAIPIFEPNQRLTDKYFYLDLPTLYQGANADFQNTLGRRITPDEFMAYVRKFPTIVYPAEVQEGLNYQEILAFAKQYFTETKTAPYWGEPGTGFRAYVASKYNQTSTYYQGADKVLNEAGVYVKPLTEAEKESLPETHTAYYEEDKEKVEEQNRKLQPAPAPKSNLLPIIVVGGLALGVVWMLSKQVKSAPRRY